MTRSVRTTAEAQIRRRYLKVKGALTERARRLFVASEAMAVGHGGIAAASRATGMAASVIGRGIAEVRAIERGMPPLPPTRSRRPGGGRKKATVNSATACRPIGNASKARSTRIGTRSSSTSTRPSVSNSTPTSL